MLMKRFLNTMIGLLCCSPMAVSAQITIHDVKVIHETDTIWNFGLQGVNLYSRSMHRIDIVYPSTDPKGNPTEMSGYVAIPNDIYKDNAPVDGILLNSHYTQMGYDGAPTRGYAQGEDYVMANPLRLNYIVVCSDQYGYGVTEGKGYYYCYGDANAQAGIDCLLAARELLDARGISQGKLLINAGYSSGGYEAIAIQKLRDMKYRDVISFDKTVVGGLPFDIVEAYDEMIAKKNDTNLKLFGLLMILDSYNTHAELGLDIPSLLYEPAASMFDEWFHTGKYSTQHVKDALDGLAITEVVKDTLLNSKSPVVKMLKQAMKDVALENDWEPDTTQNYFVLNVVHDCVVPAGSCRALPDFLANYRYDGKPSPLFKKSIVPEQTHLQTNFVIPSDDHVYVGGIAYYLNLAAMMAALPILYYDGELNTYYADLVKDATPMTIIHKLEEKGIDLKKIVRERMASEGGGAGDFFSLLTQLDEKLEPYGFNSLELLLMADDSGLSLIDILEIYYYLTSEDNRAGVRSAMAPAHTTNRVASVKEEDGTFSVMTLNVDGLPGKWLTLDVNKDGPMSNGSMAISSYLAGKNCDIIAMQEDFNYRWEIWSSLFANYQHDEWSGGIIYEDMLDCDFLHPQNIKLSCDGLNMSWKKAQQSKGYERVAWQQSFGKFSHDFDDMVTKGFRRHEMVLEDGSEVVVYNMHMDASSYRDESNGNDVKDREARLSQWTQLRDYIMAHLDKRPVIVMGDMNTLYHRDDVKKVFFDEIEASGLATAADAWVELQQSGVFPEMGGERQADELLDKVIYINPKDAATTIVPLSYEVDREGYEVNGVALGDHYPVIVRFAIQTTKDANGVKSVEKDAEDQEWYTLQGVRKDDQKKGIGINRRGKKVLF